MINEGISDMTMTDKGSQSNSPWEFVLRWDSFLFMSVRLDYEFLKDITKSEKTIQTHNNPRQSRAIQKTIKNIIILLLMKLYLFNDK